VSYLQYQNNDPMRLQLFVEAEVCLLRKSCIEYSELNRMNLALKNTLLKKTCVVGESCLIQILGESMHRDVNQLGLSVSSGEVARNCTAWSNAIGSPFFDGASVFGNNMSNSSSYVANASEVAYSNNPNAPLSNELFFNMGKANYYGKFALCWRHNSTAQDIYIGDLQILPPYTESAGSVAGTNTTNGTNATSGSGSTSGVGVDIQNQIYSPSLGGLSSLFSR
jgi:hypothetical protein